MVTSHAVRGRKSGAGRDRRLGLESLDGRFLLSTASAEVRTLYQSILGRVPDAAGQVAAVQAIAGGEQPSEFAAGLMRSTEYLQNLVIDDYGADLLRSASASEINTGVAALRSGMSNLQLSTGLLGSDEFNIRHPDSLDFVSDTYRRRPESSSLGTGDFEHRRSTEQRPVSQERDR